VPIHRGGEPYDLDNLQSLCHRCHRRKTMAEAKP
jgi:5-methylcytosine-specific restriction endonuclease McrA